MEYLRPLSVVPVDVLARTLAGLHALRLLPQVTAVLLAHRDVPEVREALDALQGEGSKSRPASGAALRTVGDVPAERKRKSIRLPGS